MKYLLLSVHPRHMTNILNGVKTAELRRRFHAKWVGAIVVLYETSPTCKIVGTARLHSVNWVKVRALKGFRTACSWKEIRGYARNLSCLYALHLVRVKPVKPFSLPKGVRPPQSYQGLSSKLVLRRL